MAHRTTTSLKRLMAGAIAIVAAQVLSPAAVPGGAPQASAAAGPVAPKLLPDLVALRARDLYIARSGSERKLRFESALGSVGDGPIEVRPDHLADCPEGKEHASQIIYRDVDGNGRYRIDVDTKLARRPAGCMVFHPYHDHWHFEAASRYTLFNAARPARTLVAQRKMSFCLRDSKRVPATFGTFSYPQHYGACSRTRPQGISIGWADVYQSYLAGQALTLPRRMGDGLYCLRVTVDPKDQLLETREKNNSSVRAFVMRGDRISARDSARCRPKG